MAAQNADVAQRGIPTLFYVSLRVIVWAPGMGTQTPTGFCTPAVPGCGGVGEQGLRLQYRGYEQHRRLFQRTAHLLKWWGSLYREMGAGGWGRENAATGHGLSKPSIRLANCWSCDVQEASSLEGVGWGELDLL